MPTASGLKISYTAEPDLSADEFVDLLRRSTLAQRRPVDDHHSIELMLRHATFIITARCEGLLVGVARALSDQVYCTYLSDLAVDESFQRQGIGTRMIDEVRSAVAPSTTLILLAAPAAEGYYPKLGMQQHPSCWVARDDDFRKVAEPSQPALDRGPMADGSAVGDVGNFFDSLAAEYDDVIDRCFPRYREMLETLCDYVVADMNACEVASTDAPTRSVAAGGERTKRAAESALGGQPSERENCGRPLRVLELGCGTGNLSVQLAERLPNASLTLVDLSADSLVACQRRVGEQQRCNYLKADIRELNFQPHSFDLIVSAITIHHLTSEEKRGLYRNCAQWLSPGGRLFMTDQFGADSVGIYLQHMRAWQTISFQAGATQAEWDLWMRHQADHDCHDSWQDQSQWFVEAGFAKPDIVWRYLLWTMLVARLNP